MKKIVTKVLFVLVVVSSILLIFNRPIRNGLMALTTNKYLITNVSKNTIKKNSKTTANYDYSSVESISASSVLNSQTSPQDLPVIGGIAIPDLDLNLPIFKGIDNTNLLYGAGTMKENQTMGQGNYVLASHHVFGITGSTKMLFSPLENAKVGMKIYLTDKEKLYTYEVSEILEVSPNQGEVIEDVEGQNLVTLITCSDSEATGRIIVRGTLKNTKSFSKASKKVLKAFSKKYNLIN